jgi:hypothetical protein
MNKPLTGMIDQNFLEELEETWDAEPEQTFEKVTNKEYGRGDSKKISDPKERRKQRDERIKRQSKFGRLETMIEIG